MRNRDGPIDDARYRGEVCAWLRRHRIDPRDVPAERGAVMYLGFARIGMARIVLTQRDKDGERVVEDGEFKRIRRWVRVSSPPPAGEDATWEERVAREKDAMRDRIEGPGLTPEPTDGPDTQDDSGPGMTLDELCGRVDDVLEQHDER